MRSFGAVIVLTLLTVTLPATSVGANLLLNPGFETAQLLGWTRQLNEPAFYVSTAEFGITPPGGTWMFGGTHSYTGADALEILTQSVAVIPGETYRFAALALGRAEGGPDRHCRVRLAVDTDGGAVFEPGVFSPWVSGDWGLVESHFIALGPAITVGVELEQGFNHPWNWIFVDDLVLEPYAGPVPATPTPTPPPGYGAQKGLVAATGAGMTRIAAEEIADLGPQWHRYEFAHDGTGAIDVAVHDRAVARYGDLGVRLLGLVGIDTGPWPDSALWTTPSFRAAFASRAAELAARYAGAVEAWEIWNEPDLVPVRIEPEPYALLLAETFDAVKAAAPDSAVVSGGLSNALPFTAAYLDAVFRSAAFTAYHQQHGRYPLDAVAIHPYMWELDPKDYLSDQLTHNIRPVLAAHGAPDLPIWLTEIGWNTDPSASNTMGGAFSEDANEIRRAGFIANLYDEARRIPHLGPVFYFALRGWGDQRFGLIRPDYTTGSPSWTAYRAVADPTVTPTPTPAPAGVSSYWLAH